jgi:hypothetical protein
MKRICSKCGLEKDSRSFYKIHKGHHFMSECKMCFKNRVREHSKKPEVKKRSYELKTRFMQENRDLFNSRIRNWAQSHLLYIRLIVLLGHYLKLAKQLNINIKFEKLPYGSLTIKILLNRIKLTKKVLIENGVLLKKSKYIKEKICL